MNQERRLKWSKLVDKITILWLIIFIIGFFTTGNISYICEILNLIILLVFLADLVIVYKYSRNLKDFLKGHWFDIIMVIPYLRVFRIFKIFKVLRIYKTIRIIKLINSANAISKVSKVFILKRIVNAMKIIHEILDLLRTIRVRFFQKSS